MKTDSRNDVFLSALDLFMLLLFAFMGVHFKGEADRREERATIPLPIMVPGGRPSPVVSRETVLFLRWDSLVDRRGGRGAQCTVVMESLGKKDWDKVPCWPQAFGGGVGVGRKFADFGKARRRAVIECPRSEADIAACARLQWIAIENGFDATVGVDPLEKGK